MTEKEKEASSPHSKTTPAIEKQRAEPKQIQSREARRLRSSRRKKKMAELSRLLSNSEVGACALYGAERSGDGGVAVEAFLSVVGGEGEKIALRGLV